MLEKTAPLLWFCSTEQLIVIKNIYKHVRTYIYIMMDKTSKKIANHAHYAVHREKILVKAKAKRDAMSPERKQELKEYRRKYVLLNKEKVSATAARWRANNQDKIKASQKKFRENKKIRDQQIVR